MLLKDLTEVTHILYLFILSYLILNSYFINFSFYLILDFKIDHIVYKRVWDWFFIFFD